MNEQNKRIELLKNAPVPRALMAMGLPTMIGMMINALYNLADAYFVGSLGTSQMGAISVAFPLGQVIVGLGLLFGSGAASCISRLLGSGRREEADHAASTSLYSSISAGALFILCAVLLLKPLLRVLGATDSIMPYAVTYASIYLLSSIFSVFNVTMNNLATSEGAARTTMCALLSGAVLNIILDPIFIYILNLGVAGAAIATAISQFVSTFIYLTYMFSGKSIFSFRIRQCRFTAGLMGAILKIGVPTLIFQLFTSLSITLINMQANAYGDSVIAGMGAVTRIISMGSLMVFGFLKGFQPIAGYSYGAGNYGRLEESVRTSIVWSTVFCAAFGLVLALFPGAVISQFTKGDPIMVEVGEKALRANGLSFLLFGFYTVYSSLFLALGKAGEGFILGACRQGLCFVPLILLLPPFLGINGILYAQPLSDVLSAAVTFFMATRLHGELNAKKLVA